MFIATCNDAVHPRKPGSEERVRSNLSDGIKSAGRRIGPIEVIWDQYSGERAETADAPPRLLALRIPDLPGER